jgi:hypothetical protein
MWKTSKWIYLVTIVPFLALGIGFIVLGFMAPPEALTDDGYPLGNFYYFMGVAFTIFPLLTMLGVMTYYKRINDRETFLIKKGILGEAEILWREQTGTYINELPQVKFKLLIKTSLNEPYEVEYKDVVSMLDLPAIKVGASLPVYVDPDNEKNILLMYS